MRTQSFVAQLSLAAIIAASMASHLGCGPRSDGYPDVQVTSVTGKSGICHQCGRAINQVDDSHVLRLGAAEYVVCGDDCAQKQRQWHRTQFGQ